MTFSVEDEQGKVIAAGQDLDALRETVAADAAQGVGGPRRASSNARARQVGRSARSRRRSRCPAPARPCARYPSLVDEGETVGLRALEKSGRAGAQHARRHAPAAGADDSVAVALLRAREPRQRRATGADGGPARQPPRSPGGRGHRSDLVADGAGRRPGVGRELVQPACATSWRAAPPTRRQGSSPRRSRILAGGASGADPAGACCAARRSTRSAATSPSNSAGSCSPASSRPPALAAWRMSSATCAVPNGGWSGCTRRRRPTATECAPSRSSRTCIGGGSRIWPAGRSADGELSDVPWLLEQLRMSQFAQAIGSKGQVSSRKIRRILDDAH